VVVDYILIFFIRSFQQFLRFLPERTQQAIGVLLGRGAYLTLRKRRDVAVSNLRAVFPHLDRVGASAIAKKCLENLGVNFVESMVLPFIPEEELLRRFTMENRHYADDALAMNKGMMALVFHYANWEIMGVASRFLERDIIVLARPLKRHQRINEFLNRLRGETGLTVIPNANTGKDVMRYLKENKIVAILADQREKRSKAVFVDFFGRKAPTSKGIAMIGMKTGAPVVPVYYRREGFLRYAIVCTPPLTMERKGNIEELISLNTRKINEFLESIIRERPEEWFWLHRRWARKGR
jgi:Kdo2-lipid IVA lauroyltransferase/acyltransferase